MGRNKDISDDEKAQWQEAVKDVARIKPSKLVKPILPEKTVVRVKKNSSESLSLELPKTHQKNPIDPSTKAKIARGEIAIDGKIDLHGFTFENAYAALVQFIAQHHYRSSRCLLVITGKSGSLKEEVPRWLSFANVSNLVAYHTPASPKHGGAGAVYVYLTRA